MAEGRLTRRKLVGGAAAGAAAAAVPYARAVTADARTRTRTTDVVVVGAGLAGLTAARELVRAGHSVVVLEARDRVGGRTFNVSIGGGEVIDVGGEFIGPTQDHIKRLARRVGVKWFPSYAQGDNVYTRDGLRLTYPADTPAGIVPPDPTYAADAVQIVSQLDQMATEVSVSNPWNASSAEDWDSQTLYSWIKEHQANPDFMRLASTATEPIFGCEPRDISLLYTLFYIAASGNEQNQGTFERNFNTQGGAQQDRFDGGAQLVAQRVAHRLGDRVELNAPVRRIERVRGGVRVHADGITVRAGRAIVAIPPMLAGRIVYEPKLPFLRDQLTQRVPQGTLIKIDAIYNKPFWRDDGLNGTGLSVNGPVKVAFDSTPKDGAPGILLGFIGGHEGRVWGRRSKRDRRKAVLDQLVEYFGSAARNPIRYHEAHWSQAAWSRGCPVALFGPGTLFDYGRALRKPVGRIHWAGTETSTFWNGYMDGAVRSGERAAAEVRAAL